MGRSTVRGQGHPGRGHPAYRSGHGVQLPAGQGRRSDDRGEDHGGREGAVCHRLLQGRAPGGARRRAHRHRRGTALHRHHHAHRHQGIFRGRPEERPQTDRSRRGARARPCAARQGRAGNAAAVFQPRQVCGGDQVDPDPAGAQSRRRAVRRGRGRKRKDSPDQHRRQQGVQGEGSAQGADLDHARLAYLVHQERPVFEIAPGRRYRGAAFVLSQSRLSRIQRRFHAGVDLPGQTGHLHHPQRDGRAAISCVRRQAGRTDAGARGGAEETGHRAAGRGVCA